MYDVVIHFRILFVSYSYNKLILMMMRRGKLETGAKRDGAKNTSVILPIKFAGAVI